MVRSVVALLMLSVVGPAGAAGPVTPAEVGNELARVASMDLMLRASPTPTDYLLAANALSMASALAPQDAETARLAAAAAWSAGDREILIESTRSIIRADPTDTVAQLRLISSNINERQTVEQRLEAYARFLGPDGRALDASVRSHLALDAALLARETGDNARFESFLRQAVDLDGTNKSAVSLAARSFSIATNSVEDLIDWQIRLLLADPFDPHVHLTIARICAGQGALDSAARFVDNAVTLYRVSGGEPPSLVREQRLALLWQQSGPEAVLEELNGPLQAMRQQAADIIEARKEAGEPYDDIRDPQDIRYDLGIEKVRLLAANAAGDEEATRSSLIDLMRSTDAYSQEIAAAVQAPGADVSVLINELVRIFTDVQVMRCLVRSDTDLIRAEMEQIRQNVPPAAAALKPIEAWIAYADDEPQQALDMIGTPAPGSLQQLLAALCHDRLGARDTAVDAYQAFSFARPLEGYGSFARTRMRDLGAAGRLRSPQGGVLARKLATVPAWLDRMLGSARSFMLLELTVPSTGGSPLLPGEARLRLRNTAPIPLSVGASRPIGSRMLVAPRPASEDLVFTGDLQPKVIDIDHRLRLRPLEEIEVTFEPDSPYSRWLRAVNAHTTQRDRYRVIQSFQPGPKGGLINGPLGLIAESRIIQRPASEALRADFEGLLALISADDPDSLRSAITATVSRLIHGGEALALDRTQKQRLAEAWVERFARSTPDERAVMLLWLPHGAQSPEMEAFDNAVMEIIRLAYEAGEPVGDAVLASALFTRVRTPDSPLFEIARGSESSRLRAIGSLLPERARSMAPSFATVGPGVAALAPPSEALSRSRGR